MPYASERPDPPPAGLERWAWAPLPVATVVLFLLWPLHDALESAPILTTLNTLFLGGAPILVAFLAARSWRSTGARPVLFLGIGTTAMGFGGIVAGPLLHVGTNAALAVHNVAMLAAGISQLVSATLAARTRSGARATPASRTPILAAYGAVLIVLTLVAAGAVTGLLPPFWIPGAGSTPLRFTVLSIAVLAFCAAAAVFAVLGFRERSPFLGWYAPGLALIALGLAAVAAGAPGTPMNWAGRGTQYLGSLYMLVAVVRAARERGVWGIPLDEALREVEHRYRALVELSPDAILVQSDGLINFANQAAVTLAGARSLRDLLGRPVLDFVHPEDRRVVADRIRDVHLGHPVAPTRTRIVRLDGSILEGEAVGRPIELGGKPAVLGVLRDIGPRLEAQRAVQQGIEELREARATAEQEKRRLEAVLEALPIGLSVVDTANRVVLHNSRYRTLWAGATEPPDGLVDPEALPAWHGDTGRPVLPGERASVRALEGESVLGQFVEIGRLDGTHGFVLNNAAPIRDPNGGVAGAVVAVQDVTEQRQVREELRRSQERLAVAYQAAHAATWEWHLDDGRLEWSPEVYGLFGLPADATPSLATWFSTVHPADRPRTEGTVRQAAEMQWGFETEYRIRRPVDGRQRWILAFAQIAPAEGARGPRLVGLAADVTARKTAERGIIHRNRISDAFLARPGTEMFGAVLQVVLEATDSPIGLFAYLADDGSCVVPSYSGAVLEQCRMADRPLRFPPETWQGPWRDALVHRKTCLRNGGLRVPEGHVAVDAVLCAPILHQGEPIGLFELGNKPGGYDGDDLEFLESLAAHVAPVLAARLAGERQERERRRAEEALRALNNELESRVADRTAIAEGQAQRLLELTSQLARAEQQERQRLARILHDHIQQLLAAAKLHVGVLANRVPDGPSREQAGEVVQMLSEAIDAARSLTVELSPPVLEQAGLGAAVEWLAGRNRAKHGLDISVEVDPDAEPENAHERILLFDAAKELLFNVSKHAGTRRAWVRLDRDPDRRVRLVVEDEGAGFDPDARRPDGSTSGYGLFSLQQRLRYLGGDLQVQSSPGEGTRVVVTGAVPQKASSDQAADVPAPAPNRPGPSRSVGRVRVLLADDHRILRQGLASLLQAEPDIEVVGEAGDGEEAIALAHGLHPDVIVMDVNMPRLNGVEATRRIVADLPDVRVVGLSMFEEATISDAFRGAGATAFLAKGGPSEDLVAAIRTAAGAALPAATRAP